MRVVVDSNVLRDLMSASPPHEEDLDKLKAMHDFGDVELWASSVSFAELAVLLERAMDDSSACLVVGDTLTWLRICPVDESDIRAAHSMGDGAFKHRLDCACAEKVAADYVIVGDEADGPSPSSLIPRGVPGDFMNFVSRKSGVNYAVVDF